MLNRWRSNRRHILEILGKVDALLAAFTRLEDAVNRKQANPEPRNPYMDQ